MNLKEAVEAACKEPTLAKALSWIAIWETERVVKQAMRQERGPDGAMWDTTFEFLFKEVMSVYQAPQAAN